MGDTTTITLTTLAGLQLPVVTFDGDCIDISALIAICAEVDEKPEVPFHTRHFNGWFMPYTFEMEVFDGLLNDADIEGEYSIDQHARMEQIAWKYAADRPDEHNFDYLDFLGDAVRYTIQQMNAEMAEFNTVNIQRCN